MTAAEPGSVIVVGAGAAGLTAALALARAGAGVTLVGEPARGSDGRTVALLDGSVRLLADVGAWAHLVAGAAPLRELRIIDATGNLFRWRPLVFSAREIGLDAFGWNVESSALLEGLAKAVASTPGIRVAPGLAGKLALEEAEASVEVAGEGRLAAMLVVAADGQRSALREAAGIAAHIRKLPQWALTAILAHERPHLDSSSEFHLRDGPCTLVPLPGRRSSLVWMTREREAKRLAACADEDFARAVELHIRSMLGAMRVEGRRGAVPLASMTVPRLTATRLALVGEAAHTFPPIGAQGLNLGLRDVAVLGGLVREALRLNQDIGAAELLGRYDAARRLDATLRGGAVAVMNRSLLAASLPADALRGLGMAALDLVGPLRRFVMRRGLG